MEKMKTFNNIIRLFPESFKKVMESEKNIIILRTDPCLPTPPSQALHTHSIPGVPTLQGPCGRSHNTQKTKIMASGPITSWQIDGETAETVSDFIFLGSKITTDGDCSHEIISQPSSWVGPGKPNLPLGLRGKAGGGARVTAGPKRPHLGLCPPLRPLRGLQETRVATREESGVLGFPSR